ncbi:hypothetical protein PBOI14_39680 [Pseudomonas sp. Boi14]|nr:hypothetical protein PBOI14_39680 [Pseudomonas sp. Boi14]
MISSATLMANMPAFNDACELTQQHGLLGRIGLHFNLTYGAPLSPAIRHQPLFCDPQGQFDLNLRRSALRLPAAAAEAVREELQAQWQRCVDQGVRPSHIDSHQHVHNLWPVAAIVARFAAQQGVPVRLARNVGATSGPSSGCSRARSTGVSAGCAGRGPERVHAQGPAGRFSPARRD